MRTRTVDRKIKKELLKKVKKDVKDLIKQFETEKKELLIIFGLVVTQLLNIKEFEEKEDFGVVGKSITTIYTKMKNDLGRLCSEIKLRKEDVEKMALIKQHIAITTRSVIMEKFDNLCEQEKKIVKESGEKLQTAAELGIPQQWIDFFYNIEIVSECMKDCVDSAVFTLKEKYYMKRYITYSNKYLKFIENEI